LAFTSVADARLQTSRTTAQSLDEVTVKYPKAEKNVTALSDHTHRQVGEGWGGKASGGRNGSKKEREEVKGMSLGGGSQHRKSCPP
jgi:hypothetical protein